jgi:hypothetical protein
VWEHLIRSGRGCQTVLTIDVWEHLIRSGRGCQTVLTIDVWEYLIVKKALDISDTDSNISM